MKPVVYYTAALSGPLTMGKAATLITINHPDKKIQNGLPMITSPIQAMDPEKLVFETANTIYKWVDLQRLQVLMVS